MTALTSLIAPTWSVLIGSVCHGMSDAAQRLLISCFMRTAIIWVTCTPLKPPGRGSGELMWAAATLTWTVKCDVCCFIRARGRISKDTYSCLLLRLNEVHLNSSENRPQEGDGRVTPPYETALLKQATQNDFAVGRLRLWPAGPGCQTAPRRCRRCLRLQPDRPQWPGSHSSPPWSQWWRPAAWCHWLTAWCDHMSESHTHTHIIQLLTSKMVHLFTCNSKRRSLK